MTVTRETSATDAAPSDDLQRLADLAREHGLRIAVVESLTSGGFAHAIGAAPESSEWFAGGIVAYMTDVKESLLGLVPGTDPCSAECAEQLARGGRELFSADVCVATTGVGGPDPQDGHPAGTVYLGWATAHEGGHRRLALHGDPEDVLSDTVSIATELLLDRASACLRHDQGARDDALRVSDLP